LSNNSNNNLLSVGKVLHRHGLKGLLKIIAYSFSEKTFFHTQTIFIRSLSGEIKKHQITSVTPYKKKFFLKLEGINSANEADCLKGSEILIKKEDIYHNHKKDEFFWFELQGINVYLESGEYLGFICQIIATGSNDIYVVKKDNKEFLIPAIHDVVKDINLKKRIMLINPIEGLLNLNAV